MSTAGGAIIIGMGEQSPGVISIALGNGAADANILSVGYDNYSGVLINKLCAVGESVGVISNEIKAVAYSGVSVVSNELSDKYYEHILGVVKNAFDDPYAIYTMSGITYDVFIDNVSVKNQITGFNIVYDEDSIHNECEIYSIDPNLFNIVQTKLKTATPIIKITINSRIIYFDLMEPQGDYNNFTLWGVSVSIRDDSQQYISYNPGGRVMASVAADALASNNSTSWTAYDWLLPSDFIYEGNPIEGIKYIADAIGAVVRCQDDGTILIRARYQTRPVDSDSADFEQVFDDTNIKNHSISNIEGDNYNYIQVIGSGVDDITPTLEVETGSPTKGQDVYIRVYWPGKKTLPDLSAYVSDGYAVYVGEYDELLEETITVQDYKGSLSKPIHELSVYSYDGFNGGEPDFELYSSEIECEAEYAILNIEYVTKYQLVRLSGHNVDQLITCIQSSLQNTIGVIVQMNTADNPADGVSNELLTEHVAAIERGKAELDKTYDKMNVIFDTYYKELNDGELIYIDDGDLGISGNAYIRKMQISCDKGIISMSLEVDRCLV